MITKGATRRATIVTAALVAVVIAVVLVDVVRAPGARIAGLPYVDGYGTQWFYDWAVDVARGHEGWAHTARLFYPWGKDVGVHTGGNLLDAWLAWPFRAALGPAWGYDAWIVALLAANAFGGWCLAGALGDAGAGPSAPQRPGDVAPDEPHSARRRWRGLAAVGMVLHPFVLAELQFGRPTQALLVFPALALALLVRGLRDGSAGASLARWLGEAVACGGLVALTGWTYWFHGVALGACAGAWSLAHLAGPALRREGRVALRDAGWLALAAGTALLAVWPAVGPMLAAVDAGSVPGLLAWDGTAGPLAPLALRTVEGDAEGLAVLAVLRGGVAQALLVGEGLRFDAGWGGPGWTWMVATLLAAGSMPRGRRLPMMLALTTGLVLAGGPVLVVGEQLVASRPYLWLLEALPWLRRWWWPVRAVAMVQVLAVAALPALFGTGEAWLVRRAGASWGRAWGVRIGIPALALALLLGEPLRQGTLPLASWDASGSPVLARLRQDDGFGGGASIEVGPPIRAQGHSEDVAGRQAVGVGSELLPSGDAASGGGASERGALRGTPPRLGPEEPRAASVGRERPPEGASASGVAGVAGAVGQAGASERGALRGAVSPPPQEPGASQPRRDATAGERAERSAVIDVPWVTDQDNLWLQVLHGRPILGGMLVTKAAFVPASVTELRARNALLRGLEGVAAGDWRTPFVTNPAACAELRGLGYGWILARVSGFRRPDGAGGWESAWARPRRILGEALGAPEIEDARFALWRVEGACPASR